MAANEFKVKIDSAIMFVRKVKLSLSVFLAHAKALENSTAKYPIRRVMCKTITIPNGFRDISHEKLLWSATDASGDCCGQQCRFQRRIGQKPVQL